MSGKSQRKYLGVAIAGLVCALLATATYTWNNTSQYKTNRFKTTDVRYNVVLVEEFNPEDALNWVKEDSIIKKLSVRNGQDSDDIDTYSFDDAYVRVQFKEYFEISKIKFIYSDTRFMVDTSGNFIKEETQALLEARMLTLNIKDTSRIVEIKGFYDDKDYFYIATQHEDINGQYGKFLVMDVERLPGESLVQGQTDQSLDAEVNHHADTNKEDEYFIHKWDNSNPTLSYADPNSPFTEYVKWQLGDDVITLEDWVASGSKPVKKWILDTSSSEGWAYWGERLIHSNTPTDLDSVTTNLIESMVLLRQPEGIADYYIHANLDAVSFHDIDLWTDAPASIKDALKDWKTRLTDLVADAQNYLEVDYTPASYAIFDNVLTSVTPLLQDVDATQIEFELAYANLTSAINQLDPIATP